MVPWAHPSPHPKQHLDRFSRFCRLISVTDRQTDRPRYSVSNHRPHLRSLRSTAMRSNNTTGRVFFQQTFRTAEFCMASALLAYFHSVLDRNYTLRIRGSVSKRSKYGGIFNHRITTNSLLKAKPHYAILVADRTEVGCKPAVSWNLAYHALCSSLAAS